MLVIGKYSALNKVKWYNATFPSFLYFLLKDKKDGIKAEARYTSLNDMYELWRDLKRGIKNNTFENYKYMYETFVRNQIGSQFIMSIKKTDIKRYYNSLVDERHLKPATIDSIHTVLHQVFEMAVDDDYIRSNPTDNVLRELKNHIVLRLKNAGH